jgi:DNA repair protein RadC
MMEAAAPYRTRRTQAEDATIRRALRILETRLREPGAALSSPAAVRDYLALCLGDREHEVFAAVFLDACNRVIATEELFRGTLTQTSVYPREVVKRALALNAAGLILAHNHPSGVAEPSQADHWLTGQLKRALDLVDVRTLDHFIVAGAQAVSFTERGWMDGPPEVKAAPAEAAPGKPTPRRGRPRKANGGLDRGLSA